MTNKTTLRTTAWLFAVALLASGCATPQLKLFATYSGATPPADIQTSRVALVHVAKNTPGTPLEEMETDFRGDGFLPWGAQVKGIVEDSLDKMQIDYAASDLSYSGTTDLPTLLEYARDNDSQYLMLFQSDVVTESDFSMSFFTGSGSVSIETNNVASIYRVSDGERLFHRDYLRKLNRSGITKKSFRALQGVAAMISLETNANLNQFWEDVAFELRNDQANLVNR